MNAYFPHDSSASRDYRILKLEDDLGLAGYAIYFKILEIMCEKNTYFLEKNYKILSKLLKKNQTFLKKVVEKFELFDIDLEKNIFSSKFLQAHLEVKENISNARKLAGLKGANNRWNKQNVDSNCHSVAILPSIAKNGYIKENKINIKENTDYVSIKENMAKSPTPEKKTKNFEEEVLNAPLENENPKSTNDWEDKKERFNKNFQSVLDDEDFSATVQGSYPQFSITELQIIANEFRVRNEQASKYNGIFWDKDYITELKNHFLNFIAKKLPLKIQTDKQLNKQNNGNNQELNTADIGTEFITEYGDTE